ncbi:hypothetical protein F5B21DRAFT_501278 [Xylaria acuta]|nr:hypothetical protein F5B21DRAFT_501278 [Xylaria acuta]
MGKSKFKKKAAENKLQQEQEDQTGFFQTPRESAPSPEPLPVSMEATRQQTQDQSRVSWEQYANCKSLSQFRDLSSSNKVTEQNPDKARQDLMKIRTVNGPKLQGGCQPTKPTYARSSDSMLDNSPKGYQHVFGKPSPLRHGSRAPLWVRADVETAEITPRPEPSLDDLYNEHPGKRLEASVEPSTLNLAASVIIHVINEAGYQWFNRWCPGMNLREVFENISVEGKGSQLADKRYNVPPGAIDTLVMTTSLAGMYRRCHDVHPKGAEDIQFPKLLKLIDECIMFLRALKAIKPKTLLQKTRSMFQRIPIGLDAKKLIILKRARVDLEELNGLCKHSIGNSKVEYDNLKQKHQEGQLRILDEAIMQLNIHRKAFETEVLDWLKVLLASTDKSPPKPNVPEVQ